VDFDSGLVFVYDETKLYAIDAISGKLVWSQPQDNSGRGTSTTPTVSGGILFTTDKEGPVTRASKTGELLWKTVIEDNQGMDSAAPCTPDTNVVAYVVFGANGNRMVGLDASTGSLLWSVIDADSTSATSGNTCMHNPAAEGAVYFCQIHNLASVDCATGRINWKWHSPAPGNEGGLSSPSVSQGSVYVGCDDFSVDSIDIKTGQTNWRAPVGSYVWSDPIRAGDSVYVGCQDGGFYSFCA
jgi:outer membrane protein assembly factor BamB